MGIEGSHHLVTCPIEFTGRRRTAMKTFDQTNKFAVAKDSVGIDITELEKLREVKKNISDPELRKKLNEEIKKAEEEYMKRALATNVAEENRKERERKRDEALEIVDALASAAKKLVKWAYRH